MLVVDSARDLKNSTTFEILQVHLLNDVNTRVINVDGNASGSSIAGNIMAFKTFCWSSTPPEATTSAASDRGTRNKGRCLHVCFTMLWVCDKK